LRVKIIADRSFGVESKIKTEEPAKIKAVKT